MSPACFNTCSKRALEFFLFLAVASPCVLSLPSQDLEVSPLDCDALSGPGAGQQFQANLDNSSLLDVSDAPSDAPSAAPLCSDRLSNARGVYTSTHAPCTIKFHSITQFQREGEEKEVEFIDYRTSNLCHSDNVIVEIKEYLENFPDECVGDFDRCYSLEHHSKYLYPYLCLPEENNLPSTEALLNAISYQPRWELPPGTTHVSVDCTADRGATREEIESRYEEARKHNREARREEIGMKLFNWVLVFLSSLAFVYALSHVIVTPLVTLAASRRNRRRRRRRSSRSCRRSRTIRTSSTLSSSLGSLPLHHHEQQVTLIAGDGVVVQGHPMAESTAEDPESSCHDNDADNSASSSSDDSYSYETVHEEEEDDDELRMNDFNSQVPCDFDAVPIVAATFLSMSDAIPATVVQDGVTYS
jgi:hypothetical protein